MNCCDTKIIQVGGAAGGGPYTVAPNTPTDQFVTITDTASGNTFVIDLSKAIAITDADGDTGVATVEGGGANGGDKTVFNVDGVEVGSVEILLGGLTKWTFDGLVDPVAFLATPQTAVAIAAFSPTAGWLVYNGDTNAYQYYNGTSWVVLPGATTVKAWAATTAYAINEVVSATSPSTGHVGLYRRIAAGTSGATFNTGEEANWATLSTVGASRVFLSDTTVAPAIAGEPTVAEITVAVTASNVKDLLVYYTGTNTAGDTPTYVYWVDAAGTVTTIQSPSASTGPASSAAWNFVLAPQTLEANKNYILLRAGTYELPAGAARGDTIEFVAGTTGVIVSNVSGYLYSAPGILSGGTVTLPLYAKFTTLNVGTDTWSMIKQLPARTAIADSTTGTLGTVDSLLSDVWLVNQTTAAQVFTFSATPAESTYVIHVQNTGTAAFTLEGKEIGIGKTVSYLWNGTAWSVLSEANFPAVNGGVVFGNGTALVQDATNFFYDNTNDRLGIGTATPASKIHIVGDGFATPNNAGIRLDNTGASPRSFMLASRSDGSNSRFAISDETAGAVRVTVGTNGFMGIGEEGPGTRLHIKGDSNGDANQAAVRFQNDGPSGRSWNVGTRGDGGTQRFYVSDETGAAERFGIDSTGRTWVGQGAGPQLIPGYGSAGLNVISIAGSDGMSIRGPGANNALNIYQANSASVGITYVSFISDQGGAGSQKGKVEAGPINGVIYSTTSDERLKTDTGKEAKGLEDLLKIKVRNYDWKAGGNQDGMFAQELAEIVPCAVSVGNDELDHNGNLKNPWGVDYGKLTPILVKAVQELTQKVAELEAKLNSK